MNHGTSQGSLTPIWIHERKKPRAAIGELGTIAQCISGDVVACESLDGKRVIYLEIAWIWKDGAAQVRLYDFEAREISCCAELLRTVQSRQRVRWLGVRAK